MASSDQTSDVRMEAMKHFTAGKRSMLVQDIPAAVDNLAMACEMLSISKPVGESSTEIADAYFHYGKALLEMSRLESDVLGNALEGIPEGEDDAETEEPAMTAEEKEEVCVQVLDALDENFQTHEEKIALLTDGHTKQMPEADEEEDEDAEEVDDAMDIGAEKAEVTEKAEDEEEEEPSNLQLAWEMLELAKGIYTKKVESEVDEGEKAEFERKLCETFMTLGEVSLENENFKTAVDDLTVCLTRRQQKMPRDSRSIAEIHYQLGVAQGFSSQFEEAVKSFNAAIDVITLRIANLAERTESKDVTRTDDASYTRENEMMELEKLIPEIREKIADTNEMKAESMKVTETTTGFSAGMDKPVSNITAKPRSGIEGTSFSLKESRLDTRS